MAIRTSSSSSSSFEWTRFLLRVIFIFYSMTALIAEITPGSEARAWSSGENATSTVYKKGKTVYGLYLEVQGGHADMRKAFRNNFEAE